VGRGTGLGLTISQEIARAHDGGVRIDSRLGEGTTVEITIGPGGTA
jgi:two-component system sensor histidine kinase VicK